MYNNEILTNNISSVNKEVFGLVFKKTFTWCKQQKPCIQKLWFESWEVDQFGDRWVELNTSLPDSTFRQARKALKDAGLFDFRTDTNPTDNRRTSRWMVRNLQGSKSHLFSINTQKIDASLLAGNLELEKIDASPLALDAHLPALNASLLAGNLPETHTPQSSYNPSLISQNTKQINTEKEINNTNTLYENKYIKPDLDQARTRDENIELEHEPKEKTIAEKLAEIQKIYEAGKAHEVLGYSDIHARRFI
jgi:hypothetical protein